MRHDLATCIGATGAARGVVVAIQAVGPVGAFVNCPALSATSSVTEVVLTATSVGAFHSSPAHQVG